MSSDPMYRAVTFRDVLAYEEQFGTDTREQFWQTRMNAGDVGTRDETTIYMRMSGGSTSSGLDASTETTAKATPDSDGGTGSGGGSVADLMRELRDVSDYAWQLTEHIAPSLNNRLPSCTGVISQLDNAIVGLEKRAEAAEAKVKELEADRDTWKARGDLVSQSIDERDEEIATLTRQLGEEREACDAMRRRHGYPENFRGRTIHCCVTIAGDFRCSDCRTHDARREREKQGDVACQDQARATADTQKKTTQSSSQETLEDAKPTGASASSTTPTKEMKTDPPAPTHNGPPPRTITAEEMRNMPPPFPPEPGYEAATVTDDERRVALAWHMGRLARGETRVESVATLIARIRHQRDGEIRELVEALRRLMFRRPMNEDYDRGTAILAKYGHGLWVDGDGK